MTDTENPSMQPESTSSAGPESSTSLNASGPSHDSSSSGSAGSNSALLDLLQTAGTGYAGQTFLDKRGPSSEHEPLDYGEFATRVQDRAERLRAHGVAPGEKVALCYSAWMDFVLDCFAVWTLKATVAALPARWSASSIQSHLQQSGSRFLCCSDSVRAKLEPVWSGLDFLEAVLLPAESTSESPTLSESQRGQQPKHEPEFQPSLNSRAEVGSNANVQSIASADSNANVQSIASADSNAEVQSIASADSHAEVQSIASADSKPDAQSNTGIHSKPAEPEPAFIAYTAGTEGDPAGVFLNGASLARIAFALHERFADIEIASLRILGNPGDLHCLVGGVLLAMHRGATVLFDVSPASELRPESESKSDSNSVGQDNASSLQSADFLIGRARQCQSWLARVKSFAGTALVIHDDSLRSAPVWPGVQNRGSVDARIFYNYGLVESVGIFALKEFRPGSESGYIALDGSVRIGQFQISVSGSPEDANEATGEGGATGAAGAGQKAVSPEDQSFSDAPDGSVGEIWIKCDYLADGFDARNADHQRTQFRDGWLRTGDLGYKKGKELFIVSRAGEQIIRADVSVYAPEVERAILSLEGVQDCAVVGMKDAKLGQEVLAFVQLEAESSLDGKQIKNAARNSLTPERLPGKLEIVSSLPYNREGKIQKNRLAHEFLRKQKLLNRIPGQVDIDYQWVYGKALSRFYTGLREEEKIYGTLCPQCRRVQVPPKVYCGICFVECTEYVEVPRTGVLESFTTVHLEYPGQPRKPPYTYGYIKLDGSHTHLYHLVDGLSVDDIRTGMRVEAVWKPRSERKGTLYDIQYFQPVE